MHKEHEIKLTCGSAPLYCPSISYLIQLCLDPDLLAAHMKSPKLHRHTDGRNREELNPSSL